MGGRFGMIRAGDYSLRMTTIGSNMLALRDGYDLKLGQTKISTNISFLINKIV